MSVRQLVAPEHLETPRPLPARSPVPERVTAVAVSGDLSRVAVATATPWFPGLIEVLFVGDSAVVRLAIDTQPRYRRSVIDLVFDPDGSALTAMDSGKSLYRWTLDTPEELWSQVMPGRGGSDVLDLAQAATGGRFLAASNTFSQNVVVWDTATRQVVHEIGQIFKGLAYEDRVRGEGPVALSADGSRLAFSRTQRWDSKDRVVVQEIGQETSSDKYTEYRTGIPRRNGLAFSQDGAKLAVVGVRHETVATVVDLNDPARDPEPVVLPTDERVDRINLRPVWRDAEPLVPIIDRSRVTVWNAATGTAVLSVDAPGPRAAATLSPDGHTLVIASPDDGVHAHPLP